MSRPLRVLFALGSLGGGGAERQALVWLRHLDRTRFKPTLYLVTRRGELLPDLPADVPVVAYEERHTPPRVYIPGRVYRRQVRDLEAAVAERRIDVLVTVTLHMTLLAAGTGRRPPGWIAVEMADPRRDFADQVRRFRSWKRRRLADAYRIATPVAVSEGVKEGLVEFYGTPRERVAVLPNFLDLQGVDHRAAEPGPELPADRFHVVTVGRFQPQKGHSHLLDAFSRLVTKPLPRRPHLHLLGQGPLREELEQAVRRSGLTGHVTFAGFVANPLAYVRRCDLFCLPSFYEGMPVALLEAMACEVPVIASDCPSGPREALAGGEFGRLVSVGNPAELAEAIEQVLVDPAAARAAAAVARWRVEEEYSVPVGMRRLERLLDAVTDRPPPDRP